MRQLLHDVVSVVSEHLCELFIVVLTEDLIVDVAHALALDVRLRGRLLLLSIGRLDLRRSLLSLLMLCLGRSGHGAK